MSKVMHRIPKNAVNSELTISLHTPKKRDKELRIVDVPIKTLEQNTEYCLGRKKHKTEANNK